MVILITTYENIRGRRLRAEEVTYLLMNAEPVNSGGIWAVWDEDGFWVS